MYTHILMHTHTCKYTTNMKSGWYDWLTHSNRSTQVFIAVASSITEDKKPGRVIINRVECPPIFYPRWLQTSRSWLLTTHWHPWSQWLPPPAWDVHVRAGFRCWGGGGNPLPLPLPKQPSFQPVNFFGVYRSQRLRWPIPYGIYGLRWTSTWNECS